jgi:hypothetical protein
MKAILMGLTFSGVSLAGDVRLTIHWVELSHDRATALLTAELDGDALFQKARELVKAKEARLVNTQLLQLKLGESARAESWVELTYPTESEPSELPRSAGEDARLRRMSEGWWRALPGLPFVPVNFETRSIGEALEFGYGQADGSFAAELSFHPRMTPVATVATSDGKRHDLGWPNFEFQRISGSRSVGGWQLSSVLTPQDATGKPDLEKKILVFSSLLPVDD